MLNRTSCLCGTELKDKKFDSYTPMKLDDKFYGGRVSMSGNIKCECGRQLRGYFERKNNNLELIDLEIVNNIDTEGKSDLNGISDVDLDEMSYKELQEYAKAQGIEKVNVKREELIEQLK